MKSSGIIVTGFAAICTAFISTSALGGAHTWRVIEAFSTADGINQYIELQECCGGTAELGIGGAPVTSNSHTFNFPASPISGNTANRHILLGTAGYAAMTGAVAPDFLIPANFFNPNGDTLKYSVYDTWTFGAGVIPTDCIHSGVHAGGTAINNPENYSHNVGQVSCTVPKCIGDTNSTATVDIDDLVTVITHWSNTGANVPGDTNHNNVVDIDDLVLVITHWGPC